MAKGGRSQRASGMYADEIVGYELEGIKKDIKAIRGSLDDGSGGLVTQPAPDTPFVIACRVDSKGTYITLGFQIPSTSIELKGYFYRVSDTNTSLYITQNGIPKKHHFSHICTKDEANAEHVEVEVGPFHAGKTFKLAFLRAVEEGDARSTNPDDETLITATPVDGLELGTFDTGDYLKVKLLVTGTGAATLEKDGWYFPVTFDISPATGTSCASAASSIRELNAITRRVGTAASATAYGREIPHHFKDITDAERTAGTMVRDIGPFKKVGHQWNVTRLVARLSFENIGRTIRQFSPVADADVSTVPADGKALATLSISSGILYAPSTPASSDIVVNTPDGTTEAKTRARVGLRIWADHSNHAHTFRQSGVTKVQAVVQRSDETDDDDHKRIVEKELQESELDLTYVIVYDNPVVGRGFTWKKNLAFNEDSEKRASALPGSPVTYKAGAATGDQTLITSLTVTVTPITGDNRHSKVATTFNVTADANGNFPIVRRIDILESDGASDAAYSLEKPLHVIDDDTFHSVGAKSKTARVKHPAAATRYYKAEVYVVGSNTPQTMASGVSNLSGSDSATDLPIRADANGVTSPTSANIVRNHIIGDPAHGKVECVIGNLYMDDALRVKDFYSPYATFGPVRSITAYVINLVSGQQLEFTQIPTDPLGGTTTIPGKVAHRLEAGKAYRFQSLQYFNNGNRALFIPAIDFVAGSASYGFDATALTSVSVTYAADNEHHGTLTVNFTQPATPVFLKKLAVEISYNNGGVYARTPEEDINFKNEADQWSVAGAKSRTFRVKHKKGIASQLAWRVTFIPVGNNFASSSGNLSTSTTSNTSPGYSTAAPAPTFVRATIGPQGLVARFNPADNRPFNRWEYQFADNSANDTTTARDWLSNVEDGTAGLSATAPTNSGTSEATFVNVIHRADNRYKSHVQKRDLAATFKSNASNGTLTLFVRARVVDYDDTSATTAERLGTWSTWGTVTFENRLDRDSDVPLRNTFHGRGNLIIGGGCYSSAKDFDSTLAATDLGKNARLTPGGTRINTTTANGVYWDKALHAIRATSNANGINWRLKKGITANETYMLSFLLKGGAVFTPNPITVAFYDEGTGASLGGAVVLMSFSAAITTAYEVFVARFKPTANPSGNLWLRFVVPTNLTGTNYLLFDNFCLVRGEQAAMWEPAPSEWDIDTDSGVSVVDTGTGNANLGTGLGNDSITSSGRLDLA